MRNKQINKHAIDNKVVKIARNENVRIRFHHLFILVQFGLLDSEKIGKYCASQGGGSYFIGKVKKGKVYRRTGHEGTEGGSRSIALLFL